MIKSLLRKNTEEQLHLMIRRLVILTATVVVALSFSATSAHSVDYINDWIPLIEGKDFERASELCTEWTEKEERLARTEGYKCLANVEYQQTKVNPHFQQDHTGGGMLRSGVGRGSIDKALTYLDKAAEITPEDLSIHVGRIAFAISGARFDRVPSYLKKALVVYDTLNEDMVNLWLETLYPLFEAKRYEIAFECLTILHSKGKGAYPGSYKVVSGIGALYIKLEQEIEGRNFIEGFLKEQKTDGEAHFVAARFYETVEDFTLAEVKYKKAIELFSDEVKGKGYEALKEQVSCAYAELLIAKLGRAEEACALPGCAEKLEGLCKDN